MKSAFLVLSFVPLAFGGAGCSASVEGKVNTSASASAEVQDFDKPVDTQMSAMSTKAAADANQPALALLGSRQDLSYQGPPTTTCKCLNVVMGQPADGGFRWSGEKPRTNPSSQLVIAVSSAGLACPEAGDQATGASYWGYEAVGSDIVVVVERAYSGRPLASGAIIPRPANGQVYVRPIDKKLPYGKSPTGLGDRCQVGKLAPVASPSQGPAPASLGTDAPVEKSATSIP
ncbi:MAG TPA: hypothetical protein VHE30_14640 [Polyangiaceae bacterium]|nr:hypothetical protein [Polyangiaceae bacterium]